MVRFLSILITILFSIRTSVTAQPGRAIYYIYLQQDPKQPGDPFIIMEVRFLIIAVNVHKFKSSCILCFFFTLVYIFYY